jgi:two-component system sensor histidine kinase DesK
VRLLLAGPWRWVWFTVVVLSVPVVSGWNDFASTSAVLLLGWIGYVTATITSFALMAYGLSAMVKLDARNRVDAIRVATEAGWL